MPAYTAPALLIGLGARILLDTFTRTREPNLRDFLLVGAWQGVALQHTYKNANHVLFVGLGIIAKLLHDFNTSQDYNKLCATVLGSAIGFICTDFVTQVFDDSDGLSRKDRRKNHGQRRRTVQFRGSLESDREGVFKRKHAVSDITSIDSDSELIPLGKNMTPIEREIAGLRARASLADSERRRFKEERKWAISQGNIARASQMKWEVKRYTALMENFNKQADAKVLEAADSSQTTSGPRNKPTLSNGSAKHSELRELGISNRTTQRSTLDKAPQHRQFSGTLKSALRDPSR